MRQSSSPLKVYVGSHLTQPVVVAARSWREVSRITGQSVYYLTRYWSITGNDQQIAAAMARPGEIVEVPSSIYREGRA